MFGYGPKYPRSWVKQAQPRLGTDRNTRGPGSSKRNPAWVRTEIPEVLGQASATPLAYGPKYPCHMGTPPPPVDKQTSWSWNSLCFTNDFHSSYNNKYYFSLSIAYPKRFVSGHAS